MPKEIAIQIQDKERTVSELFECKKFSIDYCPCEYGRETKKVIELVKDLANWFEHELK